VTYPDLNIFLGGTTLPDFRGAFLRGNDNGRGFDTGRVLNTYQADDIKTHLHYISLGTSLSADHTH